MSVRKVDRRMYDIGRHKAAFRNKAAGDDTGRRDPGWTEADTDGRDGSAT